MDCFIKTSRFGYLIFLKKFSFESPGKILTNNNQLYHFRRDDIVAGIQILFRYGFVLHSVLVPTLDSAGERCLTRCPDDAWRRPLLLRRGAAGRPQRHCSAPHPECASQFPSPVYPIAQLGRLSCGSSWELSWRGFSLHVYTVHVFCLCCQCSRYCYKVILVPLVICRAELAIWVVLKRHFPKLTAGARHWRNPDLCWGIEYSKSDSLQYYRLYYS